MPHWLDRLTGMDRVLAAAESVGKARDEIEVQKAAVTFSHATVFGTGASMELVSGGKTRDIKAAYSNSWVAYACISRIATDASGIPLYVLSNPTDPDSRVPAGHPLAMLFAYPSPFFSQSEMVEWLFTWLSLRGEFFVRFDDPINPKQMLFWDDPAYWREVMADNVPAAWKFQNGGQAFTGSLAEVLHTGMVNPANPWRGQAPLQAAAYAYSIDSNADVLQNDIIKRGGDKTAVWEFPPSLTADQREQGKAQLRGMRPSDGTVMRDMVVPVGAKLMDNKFMDADLAILESQQMQPDKICAVYGLSKSLLGIEDIDKYATFQGRLKVYFTQTLIPMIRKVESAFDSYFCRYYGSQWRGFVRFDMRAVEALFEDTVERFTAASTAHAAGIPWTECNRRFRLGLDLDAIPGAGAVMVSSALAPIDKLIAEWDAPADEPSLPPAVAETPDAPPEKSVTAAAPIRKDGLTQALVRKRAGDTRAKIQRDMRLLKAQGKYRGEHRKLIAETSKAATGGVPSEPTPANVRQAIEGAFAGVPDKMTGMAAKYQQIGAREGQQAIVELVTGKMSDAEVNVLKASAPWRPEVTAHIRERENLIQGMAKDLFDDVISAAIEAVSEGAESHEVQSIIAQRMQSAPGGSNRAVTIARTEIGTAYSVSRDAEMRGQGFGKHMWMTSGDDGVRDGSEPNEFDHAQCHEEVRTIGENFSCGLPFPMAPGGEAGNVINCRCETIPLVEGDQ